MRYEQRPTDPKMTNPEYAHKWLKGEWIYMTQREQQEFLMHYGPRRERKALKKLRKAEKRRQRLDKHLFQAEY